MNASTGRASKSWELIKGKHSVQYDLLHTNHNYDLFSYYQDNCQRCVPTYEMRRRGYDVSALRCGNDQDPLAYNPFSVWKDPAIMEPEGTGREKIEAQMAQWGDGTRVQITVQYSDAPYGHTFIAEQIDGETFFIDPQTVSMDCSDIFDHVKAGETQFCRIDNLEPSDEILKCCTNRENIEVPYVSKRDRELAAEQEKDFQQGNDIPSEDLPRQENDIESVNDERLDQTPLEFEQITLSDTAEQKTAPDQFHGEEVSMDECFPANPQTGKKTETEDLSMDGIASANPQAEQKTETEDRSMDGIVQTMSPEENLGGNSEYSMEKPIPNTSFEESEGQEQSHEIW